MALKNDTATIAMFRWTNRDKLAHRIEIDICWKEAGGNTFVFFDTRLKDDKYVTIGLRQLENGLQQASMSVHKLDIEVECCEGFQCIGPEGDTCCIGNFPFELNIWYRLVILTKGSYVEGFIYNHKNKELKKIAKFFPGEDSLIQASTRNSVSLEHIWMKNPCVEKTTIWCKDLIRMDITGKIATATHVQAKYQECDNSNIEKNREEYIVISHGGDTKRGEIKHNEFIEIDYEISDMIELI